MTKFLTDIIISLTPIAKKKSIVIRKKLSPATAFISADPTRLKQIFWNLIYNAVKYTPEKGKIKVNLSLIDVSNVQVEIKDTGKGISSDKLPYIFDCFNRPEAHTSEGLGLGLTLTHALVKLHEGYIQAFSKGQNQGASFKVIFNLIHT